MKKFYTLTLAAAATLTAAAALPVAKADANRLGTAQPLKTDVVKTTNFHSKTINKLQKVAELDGSALKPLNKQEDGTYSIEGIYKMEIGDWYSQRNAGEVTIDVEINWDGEDLIIYELIDPNDPDTYYWPADILVSNYDEETHTLTFGGVAYGKADDGMYAAFFPSVYDGELKFMNSLEVPFDPTTGTIDFSTGITGTDYGFIWLQFSDADYTTMTGAYYGCTDVYGAEQVGDAELPEPPAPLDEYQYGKWNKVKAPAVFVDAYFTHLFTMDGVNSLDPNDFPYEVELHQDATNPNRFRLWKPFTNENYLLAEINETEYEGQIVFDITDPDHVVIEAGMPAGFNDGDNEYYLYGLLGWQIYGFGAKYDPAQHWDLIIDFMIENGQTFETYDDATRTVTIETPRFGMGDCESAYSWRNQPCPATITLPEDLTTDGAFEAGVEGIEVDNNNAPIELYNLQGVRVSNPTRGTIVIRKQGTSVSKVLVR